MSLIAVVPIVLVLCISILYSMFKKDSYTNTEQYANLESYVDTEEYTNTDIEEYEESYENYEDDYNSWQNDDEYRYE